MAPKYAGSWVLLQMARHTYARSHTTICPQLNYELFESSWGENFKWILGRSATVCEGNEIQHPTAFVVLLDLQFILNNIIISSSYISDSSSSIVVIVTAIALEWLIVVIIIIIM